MPVSVDHPLGGPGRRARSRAGAVLRHVARTPSGVVGAGLMAVTVIVVLLTDIIAPGDPFASAGPGLRPPSAQHLMGTDNFGRDMARAVVHGLRTSMTIVMSVVAMSLVIGLFVGVVSGYRGGWVDDVLMRLTEVFQAVPLFFLALLVLGFFGAGVDNLVLLLGFTSWELLARVVRAETLSLREREFVEAARSSGASDLRIIVRHVVPNVLPAAVVVVALVGSRVILIEAALSFIGLGDPNQVSLGSLIFNAQPFLRVAWWMSVFPGVAIVFAVLGLNLTADLVNEALDPNRATAAGGRRRRAAPSSDRPPVTGQASPAGTVGEAELTAEVPHAVRRTRR